MEDLQVTVRRNGTQEASIFPSNFIPWVLSVGDIVEFVESKTSFIIAAPGIYTYFRYLDYKTGKLFDGISRVGTPIYETREVLIGQ